MELAFVFLVVAVATCLIVFAGMGDPKSKRSSGSNDAAASDSDTGSDGGDGGD